MLNEGSKSVCVPKIPYSIISKATALLTNKKYCVVYGN